MKIIKTLLVFIIALIVVFCVIIALNYFSNKIDTQTHTETLPALEKANFTVLNWNLGYAGLGKESDFVMDGGENLKPPSLKIVEKNMAGIQRILKENPAEFYQFQEAAKPNLLNWGVDVMAALVEVLPNTEFIYSTDMNSHFIPTRWALRHGLASFARIQTKPPEIVRLPNEDSRLGGIIKRQYHMIKREFTDSEGHEWVLFNAHLAAFDEGGVTRTKQLEKLMQIVTRSYQDGKYVVVGGDWNMQLVPTKFEYTTDEKFLFWLKELPYEMVPDGWKIVVDPQFPTVRSNERPYVKGENYVTIIDGFLVSPNVDVMEVKTINTDFEFTDHQPVFARFTAKKP